MKHLALDETQITPRPNRHQRDRHSPIIFRVTSKVGCVLIARV